MSVDWNYYDKFEAVNEKYLPAQGEGETLATQITTAVNKLVYKWYNDGDVYDNTHHLNGFANDLSSYANWLYKNTKDAWRILNKIKCCMNDEEYEDLLQELTDKLLDEAYLDEQNEYKKVGTIYNCDGKFKYDENIEEEDELEEYY